MFLKPGLRQMRCVMWSREFLGIDFYHIAMWFIAYSVIGWCLESIYMSWCNKKLTNRGFNKGPFCPIYGFGFVGGYLLFRPFAEDYIILYFLGVIAGTGFEFFVAILMKKLLGEVWWDYNDKPFNYKGILCLESSIAWGFYCLFLFKFLHKFVSGTTELIPENVGIVFIKTVAVIFVLDFTVQLTRALGVKYTMESMRNTVYGVRDKIKDYRRGL